MSPKDAKSRRTAALQTPTTLGANATKDISAALTTLLADVFTLYLKTKNFHWHMSGPHFRDYHLMLDEQADADLRDHRRHRRARPQDRRHHPAFDRRDCAPAAALRQ